MKRLMLILTVLAIFVCVYFIQYTKEVEKYKSTEEIICKISTNKTYWISKIQICDSWGREIKLFCVSNRLEKIISSGSDGKYDTNDDIQGFVERNDGGWLLSIKWNYGLDSTYSHHGVYTTNEDL